MMKAFVGIVVGYFLAATGALLALVFVCWLLHVVFGG